MSKTKKIAIVFFVCFFLIFSLAFSSSAQVVPGDLNGDGVMNRLDAAYLLYHTFLPELFPVEQNVDYNQDGRISDRDVLLLLSGNIGSSGGDEDDGTGTTTPPGGDDDDVPSLGPTEIPTATSTTYSLRTLPSPSPISLVLPTNIVYLEEKLLVTVRLSDCPMISSALVQIRVGDGVRIQNPKWLVSSELSHFQNSGQLGVIAFEEEKSLSGDVFSFELYGVKSVSEEEIRVLMTFHDPSANDLGTIQTATNVTVTKRPYVLGDVNCDGKVEWEDGQMLLRYLNGWEDEILYPEAMDVNEDGKVDSLDGLILMRYVNGWDVSLGRR